MGTLAVLNASQLVTLTGPRRPRIGAEISQLAIIRDGGMLIRNGKIDIVGASDEIGKNARDAEIVDAGGRVVLPGFVDAHTHLVFAGTRLDDFERRAHGETYEQIAAAGGGIWSTVEKTRAATDVDLLAQAKKHAQWFLRCGTTTVEAKSGYGLTVDDELKILRVLRRLNQETPLEIVPTFLGAHAVPREMIEAGLAVVIATDFNPGSSPTPSMPMVLSLVCTQMKMSPAEAITAATINAAYSLNLGDKIGSLEIGKLANFSIFDCKDYREIAYWFGFPPMHSVYVCGGRCVLSRAEEN